MSSSISVHYAGLVHVPTRALTTSFLLGALAACSRSSPPEPQGTAAERPRTSATTAASATAAASASAAPARTTHRADAPIGAGRFAWKAPLAVRIEESVEKKGNTAEMTYVLDICPTTDSRLTVTHRDFTLHHFNEIRADDPRIAPAMRELRPLTAAIPIFVITPEGRFDDVLDVDSMIARMRSLYDSDTAERIGRVFRDQAAMRNLKQAVGSRWSAWIQAWLGIDWSAGAEQTTDAPAPHADPSGTLKIKTVSSFLGRAPSGEIKLSQRLTIDEDELDQLMRGAAGASGADARQAKRRGRSATLLEVETTWPALRPSWAHTRKAFEVVVDGKRKRETEDHVFRFDWLGSAREKPKCKTPR